MRPVTVLLSGLLVSGPLLIEQVLAAEWERGAGLALGTYYSDNICRSNSDKIDRGAATVTPNVSLHGQGARGTLHLDAAVEYNSLADSDFECPTGLGGNFENRESVIPSLRYLGNLELVEDWLMLESDAFVGRSRYDPFAVGDRDNLDGRSNINITYHYGAGASMQRRLLNTATLFVRYYHNEQHNAVNLLGDSTADQGQFDLGTEGSGNRLTVGISGHYSEISYDASRLRPAFDNTLSSAEGRLGLRLSSSWQLTGLAGEEWNEYTSAHEDIDGSFWEAGLRWTPNERLEVHLANGERFFGSAPRMSISYRHKRSELRADYTRSLTLPRDLRAVAPDFDDPLAPGFDQLPGEPPVFSGEPTFIGNAPIINERLNLRYRFTARRTTLGISATDSKQTRLEDLSEANFTDVSLTLSRSLSSKLSANLRLSWSEREGHSSNESNNIGLFGQDSETQRVSLGFSRRLGSSTTMNLGYEYISRESDFTLNQYDENRVRFSLRHQF